MVLQLSPDHLKLIQSHAAATYPEECCGLLLGQLKSGQTLKTLTEVRPVQNAWSAAAAEALLSIAGADSAQLTKTSRYWIDPRDMLEGQRYARDRQLDIIGVYHSHPDAAAVPSECDRLCAWSQYSYMIVSVNQGVAQDYCCWSLDDDQQFQIEATVLAPAL